MSKYVVAVLVVAAGFVVGGVLGWGVGKIFVALIAVFLLSFLWRDRG